MCWTEWKIKQGCLLSLSTTLQTPSRKAWERKDCSKPLTLKKEPDISLDMDFQTFARCPAPLLGQVGPRTREGTRWGSASGSRDRGAGGLMFTGVSWALCTEAKLPDLCVPVSTNRPGPLAWARRSSSAPAPAAGGGSRVWAASQVIHSADSQLRGTPTPAEVPMLVTQACPQEQPGSCCC